jgi:rare lipoprotein A (peptidoglycan hydrolase)
VAGLGLVLYSFNKSNYTYAADLRYVFLVRDVSPDSLHSITESSIISNSLDASVALAANNIPVNDQDRIINTPNGVGNVGGVITIERAPVIRLTDAKKTKTVRSWQKTVGDLLTEQKVPEIGEQDTVTPAISAQVVHNMSVTIVRVQETDIIEKTVVAFQTSVVDDNTRYRGEPDTVTQAGKDGLITKTYHIRREDGVEVSRKLLKTDTVAMVKKIVSHPVKLKIDSSQTRSGRATWYSSRYQAASNYLDRGTNVRVTNLVNGKSVLIQIQDHMANDGSDGRNVIIDLHPTYFSQLGVPISQGLMSVKVEVIVN